MREHITTPPGAVRGWTISHAPLHLVGLRNPKTGLGALARSMGLSHLSDNESQAWELQMALDGAEPFAFHLHWGAGLREKSMHCTALSDGGTMESKRWVCFMVDRVTR